MSSQLTFENRAQAVEQKFYLTTAIAYLNGSPHVGHAYEFVSADVISRYHEIAGRKTHYLTGSDEHGQKVATTAEKLGITPQELCDMNVKKFQDLNAELNLGHHQYIRTTDADHKECCKWLWKRVHSRGDIYLGSYKGWYNVKEELFVTDREAEANGLKDPETGTPYEHRNEESYFFRMSKYHDKVYDLIKNTDFVQPTTRRNELLARLDKAPLEDLSVSRASLAWGIPVPDDPRHVMYVWFDALTNYLSGIQMHTSEDLKSKFWPADVHIVGKDIIWFHCVIWPAMLMAAELPLPHKVFGHGFVQAADGVKMSKSIGNVVDPMACLKLVPSDSFRWYVIREGHYGVDLRFSSVALMDMHNADLCATLGNLVHRALALCNKSCGGHVPPQEGDQIVNVIEAYNKAEASMANFALEELATQGLEICKQANKYLTDEAPWKIKDDDDKKARIIRTVMETIYVAAHFLWPVIPEACDVVFKRLGTPKRPLHELNQSFHLVTGSAITMGDVLFNRLEAPAETAA